MVLRDEAGHLLGQLADEGVAIPRGCEADLAVQREGRHPAPRRPGPLRERGQLPDRPPGEGDEIGRREAIREGLRPGRKAPEGLRVDDVIVGLRSQDALEAVSLPPLLDHLDQVVPLERSQVVVELLAREPHPPAEPRR